ncbi:MAG: LysR substrate-binding domain-containing protein, partial [Pararhizobium sp.]
LMHHNEKIEKAQMARALALSNEATAKFVTPEFKGCVRLRIPNDLAETILSAVLKRLEADYPTISVDIVAGLSGQLLARVAEGNLDLAIVNYASNGVDAPGEFVARAQTAWSGAKGGSAYANNPVPLAVYGEGCIWRSAALAELEAVGRSHRIAYQAATA